MTAPSQCALGSARTPRPGSRLDFLDGLRGVAVGLVLAQHVGERAFPAFQELTHSGVLLGQMGVMVFFLCSGFIIPASLERGPVSDGRGRRLAAFWRSRFFRLFPLYWLSLGAAAWLAFSGVATPAAPMSVGDWLANLSMVQMLVGVPNALVSYWTLAFEMLFYLGVSILFALRLHRHSVALALTAAAVCLALALGAGSLVGATPPTGAFCLATMLTGTVFHRWHSGAVPARSLVLCVAAVLASGVALLHAAVVVTPQPPEAPAFLAMLTAWLGAYVLFCAGIALRRRAVPAPLRRLGVTSYSVYLVQCLVLAAVPALPDAWLSSALWVVVTLAVSELTYRWVELPAVALGRRSRPRADLPPPATAPVTAAPALVPPPRRPAPAREEATV
ncbi:acyltransferase family protein [Blastococcus sp. SYSU DS0510]